MKSRQVLAIAAVIALGLPGIYLVCLAAGVDPVGRLVDVTSPAAKVEPAPGSLTVPEPPKSTRVQDLSTHREDGAEIRIYESDLSPRQMDAAMRNLMLQAGWKLDETWTREVGAKTEDGLTVVYNGRGWQCVLNIYESKSNAKGSELMIRIQPQPAVKQ